MPKKLAEIALGLRGLPAQQPSNRRVEKRLVDLRFVAGRKFEALKSPERRRILAVFVPKMAADLETTWEFLKRSPYQSGYLKKAFRAPQDSLTTLPARIGWLTNLLELAEILHDDVLEPTWLVTWAPHLRFDYRGWEQEIGQLAAGLIDADGAVGRQVFEILTDSAHNEHEIGGMGRHVLAALLCSSREEGWEIVEKMLLAAQRQEGLRQSILEAIDLAHPVAYRRMLRVILEHDLIRFSAVARAVDVWFGMLWDSVSSKSVEQAVERTLTLLDDADDRRETLAGDHAGHAYLALWATAFENAYASVPLAESLLQHPSAEMRFVAFMHLKNLGLPAATKIAWRASDDPDLRIAFRVTELETEISADGELDGDAPIEIVPDAFERLERLIARTPEKPVELEPLVWPWAGVSPSQHRVATALFSALGPRPPTRLLPYLGAFDSWRRRHVIELFSQQKTWDPQTRAAVVELAGDTVVDVRASAFAALAQLELTNAEVERLEGLLTRKAADLRASVIQLVLLRDDASALASADRLTRSKDSQQRLAGLEIWRQLAEQGRQCAACQGRAQDYLAARPRMTKDERLQTEAIFKAQSAAEVLTLNNALGLMDPAQRTPVQPPRPRKVKLVTPAAIASLKELDALVDQHRETPVVLAYRRNETVLLGTIQYGFPHVRNAKNVSAAFRKLPLSEVWSRWLHDRPKKLRDPDGLELLRAQQWHHCVTAWRFSGFQAWVGQKPHRQPMLTPLEPDKCVPLKYPGVVLPILEWLLAFEPPANALDFLSDAAEHLYAQVPQEELDALVPAEDDAEGEFLSSHGLAYSGFNGDWRSDFAPYRHWMSGGESVVNQPDALEHRERQWRLLHWLDQPLPGAPRLRPSHHLLWQAYRDGHANLHDVADDLAGPRESSGSYYSVGFAALADLTARRPEPTTQKFLEACPEVGALVERVRTIVLDAELERGDVPTAVSELAFSLKSIYGVETLARLLRGLGKAGF
ncbi:MAG: DUF5724 domain-containing protein [Planctomycetaceae bacterium]|nr:DUF5724 domain-containing protein [Planctomycetaceae bacterium]